MKFRLFKKKQQESKNQRKKLHISVLNSIKTKMVALVGLLLLFVCIGFALVSYYYSSNALISQAEGTLPIVAEQSAKVLESRINESLSSLITNASRYEIWNTDSEISKKLTVLYGEMSGASGRYNWMGIAEEDGMLYSTNGKTADISDKDYFKSTMEGKDFVTEPNTDEGSTTMEIIFSVPIKFGEEIVGVLAAGRNGLELCDFIQDITYGESGKAFIIDGHGKVIAHTDKQLVYDKYNIFEQVEKDATLQSLADIEKKMIEGETSSGEYVDKGIEKYIGYAPIGDTGWSIGVEAPRIEVLKQLETLKASIIMMSVVFILLSLVLAFIISGTIAKPVKLAVAHLNLVATGDFTRELPKKFINRKDEFGYLAKSIDVMQNSIRDVVNSVKDEASNVDKLIDNAISSISSLGEQIEDVSATTREMSAGMEETAASTEEMNATSTDIDKAVEAIAANAQNGAVAAGEISNKANRLSENFTISRENALKVFNEVKEKLEKALADAKAVEQINVLADAILEITNQTNLLALNAAIEAARAGEAGRGFSVVADEIRKLAENSSNTAVQIQEITNNVVQSVENLSANSNNLLNFMATDVNKDYNTMLDATEEYKRDAEFVASMVTDFNSMAEELSASMDSMVRAINEITASNNEAAEGTQDIAQKTVVVVECSNEVLTNGSKTKESANNLMEAVRKFKI